MKIKERINLVWIAAILFTCVSCLDKEDEGNPDPAITSTTTQNTANATFNTLTVSGNVDNMGNDITARGIVLNTTGNPTITDSKTTEANNIFTTTLSDLDPNTTYYVKVYATTSTNTYYSEEIELDTRSLAGTTWDFLFKHTETITWNGDVTFNADGTTAYDEPAEPGVYYTEGIWSMTGNQLTYIMDSSKENPQSYVFTATLEDETMIGTYTFGENDNRPFTATER